MHPETAALSIAAVERETGVAKDTLRVWEKRYGFPAPLRDAAGDRIYPLAQVVQLKVIRRLLDAGMRPGKVVPLDNDALQALLAQHAGPALNGTASGAVLDRVNPESATKPTPPQAWQAPEIPALLDAIAAHDPQALRHTLLQAQWRMGLAPFVTEVVAPLTTAVGEAWAQGRFEIFEEHLYTEVITGVLRSAIATLAMPPQSPGLQRPRVLLTTVQREPHGLGLLMLEALLTLEGCVCISLGTQTPLSDIVQAAQVHRANVVALSFTNLQSGPVVITELRELRRQLPPERALWVGGSCSALYQKPLLGITAVQSLSALAPLVTQWRSNSAASPP